MRNDHGGHLIASMFNGPGEGINLVPMNAKFNGSGGACYELETKWKTALENNQSVKVSIQPIYSGNSKRPDSLKITEVIGSGKPITNTLRNTSTGK
ncbi:DNA/RNA non-specific endonuclease [Acinetobacter seifertii]|uniref:DNA/RNA non-specific endonuclease n=1 Tax=Acinetobacter seifertii TaxID=1530123 RepID=UPI00280F476C|nr:DNA/RNA non-specific endonuclease [Acinetobacter seifertii]MDQ9036416.1 DNA/RNA non-specific endonuclease [Acinetobacter seifertii]